MAIPAGAARRWWKWSVYSWGFLALTVLGGMIVNGSREEGPFVALAAMLAYGIFIVAALTLTLLPGAVATLLWEVRWGWRRLDPDGDALGALIATACLLLAAWLWSDGRAHVVVVTWPLFIAMRAAARARVDRDPDAAAVARVITLLIVAEAVILAAQSFMARGPYAVLVAAPVLAAAIVIGVRREGLRGDAVRHALALRLPVRRSAWLVALLPVVTVLFAQLLNAGGFTYADTLPAVALVAVVSEIAFRGFAFQRLRTAGCSFIAAAGSTALITLIPTIIYTRHALAAVIIAGIVAESIWLAWLVERWKSVWIAIVSTLLLTAGLGGFTMFTESTRVWLTFALRLWIIGISVALTQLLQRRKPVSFVA